MNLSLYALLIGPFEGFSFMRIALVACLALALANGPLGILLLLRRMTLDGNVLSHAVMPGAALGFVYTGHASLLALSTGGLASGAVVAGLTGMLGRARSAGHDAGLVAFYLVTLALGVTLVAFFGSNVDTVRVLFGSVLAIDVPALLQIAAASILTMLLLALFYRPLAVDSFDPVFLRLAGGRGAGGFGMRGLFMALVLLNLVVSFQAFGTLLAIGPMLLPAAAARCWTHRPGVMIAVARLFSACSPPMSGCCCPIIATCLQGRPSSWPPEPFTAFRCWLFCRQPAAKTNKGKRNMNRFFHTPLVLLTLAGAMLLPNPSAAADRINVVATFSVIADMVTNIAGDHVNLTTMIGPGGDSEEYQPTAGDVPKVAGARILFMNGLNDEFEPWLEPLLRQARFAGTKVVVSRWVKALSAEDEHPAGGKPKATVLDQHAWMDPRNGIIYARNIADALSRIDPSNAEDYRTRGSAYIQRLRTLDSWAHGEMAAVPTPKRRVLASHDSLQYLATAFGITMISVNGWTNKSEPSAADLVRLTDQIRREHVKALFLDSITDPRAMQRVSNETGAAIGGTLYGDALSPPNEDAGTYIEMIHHDIATLKAGMLLN